MADLIDRQAAIDYCYALINAENPSDPSDEWNYSQERINQTEVILHHLEFMPSAQPEITQKDVELYCRQRCFSVITNELFNEMKARWAQPEIVRCKDCKHYAGDGMYCAWDIMVHYEHFYCYHAERRTDENNNSI